MSRFLAVFWVAWVAVAALSAWHSLRGPEPNWRDWGFQQIYTVPLILLVSLAAPLVSRVCGRRRGWGYPLAAVGGALAGVGAAGVAFGPLAAWFEQVDTRVLGAWVAVGVAGLLLAAAWPRGRGERVGVGLAGLVLGWGLALAAVPAAVAWVLDEQPEELVFVQRLGTAGDLRVEDGTEILTAADLAALRSAGVTGPLSVYRTSRQAGAADGPPSRLVIVLDGPLPAGRPATLTFPRAATAYWVQRGAGVVSAGPQATSRRREVTIEQSPSNPALTRFAVHYLDGSTWTGTAYAWPAQ